jgi:hypothetical protein
MDIIKKIFALARENSQTIVATVDTEKLGREV